MCMAADGQWTAETTVVDPATGEGRTYCPAPARYVLLPLCAPGERRPEERPELFRARLEAARDNSLHRDSFEGQSFCHPVLSGPPLPPPLPPQPLQEPRAEPRPPGIVFDEAEVRTYVEQQVARKLGGKALAEAQAAPSSVMAVIQQSMPRPIQRPDGSWTYEGPWVNSVARTAQGWTGWKSGQSQPLPPSLGAELDRMLADPALWREPAYASGEGCLDGNAYSLVIRHSGRTKVARQICMPRGVTGRLAGTVINENISSP